MLEALDLSDAAKVLTDPSDTEFQELLARWTDIDKKVPFAIVMPASEDDIVKTVSVIGQATQSPREINRTFQGQSSCQLVGAICTQVRWSQCVVHDWLRWLCIRSQSSSKGGRRCRERNRHCECGSPDSRCDGRYMVERVCCW